MTPGSFKWILTLLVFHRIRIVTQVLYTEVSHRCTPAYNFIIILCVVHATQTGVLTDVKSIRVYTAYNHKDEVVLVSARPLLSSVLFLPYSTVTTNSAFPQPGTHNTRTKTKGQQT